MPTLKVDKVSNGKDKTIYGKAGDKVTQVTDHGNVLIVENKKKQRFSVNKDEII